MRQTSWVLAVALTVLGAGCGDVFDDILPSKGSCTIPAIRSCVDYTGSTWSAPTSGSTACTAAGREAMTTATYSSSPCATASRVGSCVVNSGQSTEVVQRSYAPTPVAGAQAACGMQSGSRFVAN